MELVKLIMKGGGGNVHSIYTIATDGTKIILKLCCKYAFNAIDVTLTNARNARSTRSTRLRSTARRALHAVNIFDVFSLNTCNVSTVLQVRGQLDQEGQRDFNQHK